MALTKKILMEGFERMIVRFGPRKWWPAETRYEVMVGAILTQNTNWKNVERAITNLKSAGALDAQAMLRLNPDRLQELIRPAGYFRIKAGRLVSFLKYFVDSYDASVESMEKMPTDRLREELLGVKGIGPETADSILLYALDKPVFVVDAYTKRILSRHNVCNEEDGYAELQDLFMSSLPQDLTIFNEFHALIVETGKLYCRTKPLCECCPLKGWNGLP